MSSIVEVSRQENKFELNIIEKSMLIPKLNAVLKKDINSGVSGYKVRSLYFDTLHFNDFNEKLDGLLERKKIRLRIYSHDAKTAKLELKEKIDKRQYKRSLTISRDQAKQVMNGDYRFLAEMDNEFAHLMHSIMTINHYVPKCIVEYDRIAYIGGFNNTRITIDSNLRGSISNLNIFDDKIAFFYVQNPNVSTLEVKFDNFLPSHTKAILRCHNKPHISISKYCSVISYLFGGEC